MCLYVCHMVYTYSLTTNTMPTCIVCSHLLMTLHRGNQITIETESDKKETVQRFIEINIRYPSSRATLNIEYIVTYSVGFNVMK